MKLNDLFDDYDLDEGIKTRAAVLAAMLGAGALGGYLGDKSQNIDNVQTTISTTTTPTQNIDKTQSPKSIIKPAFDIKPNTKAPAEPKPFVPSGFLKVLTNTAHAMGITSQDDLASFLAQCNVETNNWTKSTEQFNYSTPEVLRNTFTSRFPTDTLAKSYIKTGEVAIANRALSNKNGNGNEASGDGWRYRGRGFLHVTGRELYAKAGAAIHPNNPKIYINHPEILSTNPKEAAKVAVWYYNTHVGQGKTADQATSKINPAGMKKDERSNITQQFRKALGATSKNKLI